MARATINIDTEGFSRFATRAILACDPQRSSALWAGLEATAKIYLAAMQVRFALEAAGGGEWASHSPNTIKRRISRGEQPPFAILIENGNLIATLSMYGVGNYVQFTATGIRVGIKDRTAKYHQKGTIHMPARPILVPPDAETKRLMSRAFTRAFNIALKEAARG